MKYKAALLNGSQKLEFIKYGCSYISVWISDIPGYLIFIRMRMNLY